MHTIPLSEWTSLDVSAADVRWISVEVPPNLPWLDLEPWGGPPAGRSADAEQELP